MGIIIQFDPSRKRPSINTSDEAGSRQVQRNIEVNLGKRQKDKFVKSKEQKQPKEPPKTYKLEEMISLVGIEKTDEIFDAYLGNLPDTKSATISPPDGSVSLKESLSDVWDNSQEAKEERRAKLREISRTKSAFRALEKECSRRHEEVYGEKREIKIVVSDGEDSYYLTDILSKQADFYRKNRVLASMELISKRLDYKLNTPKKED